MEKGIGKRSIVIITFIMFLLFIIVISPREMQNDTLWSIEVGEKLIKEGIWEIDDYSIHNDLKYVAHHFITDIIIFLIHYFCGFTGLYVFEILLACGVALVMYLLNNQICKNKLMSFFMLVIQIFVFQIYISVRAQMISYILFTLELLLLEKYKENMKKKYIILLSVIPILLANFHMGAVPFYFVILGVYILSMIKIKNPFVQYIAKTDKERIKALIIVFVIGLITIFINPYGIDGVIYPFKTFGNKFINSTIQEFQPFSIGDLDGWPFVYFSIIILILIFLRKKIETGDFLLIFGTLFMSFMAIRYIGLFVICSAVILRYMSSINSKIKFEESDIKALKFTILFVFTSITIVLFARYMMTKDIEYVPEDFYPIEATEFLKENLTKDYVIFNEYAWGSYLMLNDIKVFIDSRCDLYTKEYNGKDIAMDYKKIVDCDKEYKKIMEKYNINTVLIPVDYELSTLLNENIEFECIYEDDTSVIYKKIR